uniref:EGF-like domain-containing protein n=1 Tax=Heterorhabditis bacteriophora TaxID=37862 RepID=A0A1I7WMA6_HETBA
MAYVIVAVTMFPSPLTMSFTYCSSGCPPMGKAAPINWWLLIKGILSAMRLLVFIAFAAGIVAERPKIKDNTGAFLVKISDIPVGSCAGESYFGLGMMNGSLEECERWQLTDAESVREYEEYKCKHLRVHGKMEDGKCVCDRNWKGAICNEYIGCPEGHALHGKVCTTNVCQHGGSIAVGRKEVECICEVPWDGRFCERLACWRKTKHGLLSLQTYAHISIFIIFVYRCLCKDGWGGEICEKKCQKGQITFVFPFYNWVSWFVITDTVYEFI